MGRRFRRRRLWRRLQSAAVELVGRLRVRPRSCEAGLEEAGRSHAEDLAVVGLLVVGAARAALVEVAGRTGFAAGVAAVRMGQAAAEEADRMDLAQWVAAVRIASPVQAMAGYPAQVRIDSRVLRSKSKAAAGRERLHEERVERRESAESSQ